MGRARRRERQRAFVAYMLDGPPKEQACGQAKAAARRQQRADTQEQRMPKNNPSDKRAARERQQATGRPYTECLAEVRAETAARRQELEQPPTGSPR